MEMIAETDIVKEDGMLYFVKADENKHLCIYKAKAGRRPKKD